MPLFDVTLTRSYIVTVNAEDAETAKRGTEFYLGNPPDLSIDDAQAMNDKFTIERMEMAVNDAIEINEVKGK
ncbi:MAG: hypothetical protein EPO24_01900 [Bacteroidetes bacterium]|nr:MAG: hypothetical protein EPO24_01900 [Bacteroidota bacterium]